MIVSRRNQMARLATLPDGFELLRALTQHALDSGEEAQHLLDDLDQIRRSLDEESGMKVMDVMDLLTGWCAPSAQLKPNGEPED